MYSTDYLDTKLIEITGWGNYWGVYNFYVCHKIRRAENFLAAPKMVSFFIACSWEKDTNFGAARKFFGPSYIVTALITRFWKINNVFTKFRSFCTFAFTTYKLWFKISDGWEFVKLRGEKQFHIYLLVYSVYMFWNLFMSFGTIFWDVILGWYYDILGWKLCKQTKSAEPLKSRLREIV